MAQFLFPFFELAPDVAIRLAERLGSGRNRSVIAYGVQQIHERIANGPCRRTGPAKRIGKFDLVHAAKYARYACCWTAEGGCPMQSASYRIPKGSGVPFGAEEKCYV